MVVNDFLCYLRLLYENNFKFGYGSALACIMWLYVGSYEGLSGDQRYMLMYYNYFLINFIISKKTSRVEIHDVYFVILSGLGIIFGFVIVLVQRQGHPMHLCVQ